MPCHTDNVSQRVFFTSKSKLSFNNKRVCFFYTKYSKTKHELKLTPQKRFKANVPGYIVTKLDLIKNVVLKIHANANDVL